MSTKIVDEKDKPNVKFDYVNNLDVLKEIWSVVSWKGDISNND